MIDDTSYASFSGERIFNFEVLERVKATLSHIYSWFTVP